MRLLVFSSLRGYRRGWLRGDAIAVVSPVVGLYAAPGALILYAAFGSSKHLIVGPMAATATWWLRSPAKAAHTGTTAPCQGPSNWPAPGPSGAPGTDNRPLRSSDG